MRIGFDVAKLDAADGLGTFTRELLAALRREAAGHDVLTYDLLQEAAEDGVPKGAAARRPAEDALDVFVATSFVAPPLAAGTRLVFVVYDLTFLSLPHCHTVRNRLHCLGGLIEALAAPAELAAISRDGAAELAAYLGRDPSAVAVLPLAPAPDFRPLGAAETQRRLAPLGLAPGGYLLSVGSLEPRKNLEALLQAHAGLPADLRRSFPLVLAGSPGWKNEDLAASLEKEEAAGFARKLGRVDRETLVALYGGAALFAYPSLAEGYGLPVVEAMACGAPVLTSNVSALPETAGGAARLVDPRDPAAMTTALAALLASPEERRRLSTLGLERVAALSWQKTARALLDLLTRTSP